MQKPSSARPTNANESTVMILDSDDEQPAAPARPDSKHEPEFERDRQEFDPSAPFDAVIQTLHLPLATQVLHLAFPNIHAQSIISPSSHPQLFSEKIVMSLACSDHTIRVLTVPLSPPSPKSKSRLTSVNATFTVSPEKSMFGEQLVVLGSRHQNIPRGVSLSFTRVLDKNDHVEMEQDQEPSDHAVFRRKSPVRIQEGESWNLLIASHSADLCGLLLVHRIPLLTGGTTLSSESNSPWRTQYLSSPAASVQFSSALFPAPEHHLILVAETKSIVRLFDCLPKSMSARGSWVASLSTGHQGFKDVSSVKKRVLDAQWLLGGKAVLVLLDDGEWGIWDVACTGPVSEVHERSTNPTAFFAAMGRLGLSLKPKASRTGSVSNMIRSKLAPMTPGTRQNRQDELFSASFVQANDPVYGGLCVTSAEHGIGARADDDHVLMWYGHVIHVMPSFLSYWHSKVRGHGNLFGEAAKGALHAINNIQLGGEKCKQIDLMPSSPRRSGTSDSLGLSHDILVTGEHRFIIVAAPPQPEVPELSTSHSPPDTADHDLLARGELDITGMDRILTEMSNGHPPHKRS